MPLSFSPLPGRSQRVSSAPTVLFVVAHPDDESLFFAPTILAFKQAGMRVCLCCLSNGNAAGLGPRRALELKAACRFWQIDKYVIIDAPGLQDGLNTKWDAALIAEHIARQVVSFDAGGVSGHPNHCAIYKGLLHYQMKLHAAASPGPAIWTLVTTGMLRKFSSLCDLPLSLVESRGRQDIVCYISLRPWKGVCAMVCHWSQLVWFRWLFILFSRYTFVNTLRRLRSLQKRQPRMKHNSRANLLLPG
ncbi:hypothetical protein WJX72_006605 [[Myrmecia] bisecta]|uniref:N-acetylglucosaminylphosphatidylinositol deacetylase n=1 Tax=[Myrmecia] bisecta TaxID=41462 RepID=A0AAW1R876_9CHLO